jgi:beta-lactamase superfamily II metal-dependent hydrolase
MKSWTVLAALAALFLGSGEAGAAPPAVGTFRIHAIDVGTGLSIFVEGHDFTLLYDAGSNDDTARGGANRVVAYIREVRPDVIVIDHLILSHPHQDHSELMPDILTAFQVRNVWDSGSVNNICSYRALLANVRDEAGVTYHNALGGPGTHSVTFPAKSSCYGQSAPSITVDVPRGSQISSTPLSIGTNAQMTILHADGTRTSSYNEATVVVRLDLGSRRLLLAGDAEGGGRRPPTDPPRANTVEADLIECCAAAGLRADILVVGHHGSKTSSRTAFLDAIGATQFIVSSGLTRYSGVKLPDQEVLTELGTRGTIWRTDLNDDTCGQNPAKIGPDNDGRPGGCDNILIELDATGQIAPAYNHISD